MRQVPLNTTYLIIGGGRLAHHLSFLLKLHEQVFTQWQRDQSHETLRDQLNSADVVLLAISDDSIHGFYQEYQNPNKTFVHFSGLLHHLDIIDCHPLYSFSQELYSADLYPRIPFVGTRPEKEFRNVFPFLNNSYTQLKPEDKAKYHMLCVLAGNGTTLLWQLVAQEFEQLQMSPQLLLPYLQNITQLIYDQAPGRFTGPWYRGDQKTIEMHQTSLNNQNLAGLYRELKALAQKEVRIPQ